MQPLLAALFLGAPPSGWYEACCDSDWHAAYGIATVVLESDSTESDAWAAAAISAVRGGIESSAVEWSESALALDSLSSLAWVARGTVLRLSDPEGAESAFRTALDLDSLSIFAMEGLALVGYDAGDYAAAISWFDDLLDVEAFYRPAFLPLVRALGLAGETGAALGRATALSGRNPDDLDLALELGSLLEQAGRPDSAASVYEGVIRVDSSSIEALRRLGLIREGEGGFGEAVKLYRSVVEADSLYSWAYGELGWCFEALGRTDLAREWYLDGLNADPGYAWAAYRIGLLTEDGGDPDSAAVWYETAIGIDSTMSEAWVSLGLLAEGAGDYGRAIMHYQRALEIDPGDSWTWGELGYVYSAMGMYEEAAGAYETSVEVDPDYQWGWEQRGILFEDLGRDGDAIGWYATAARTAPQSSWLLGELGMLLQERGDLDSAAAVFGSSIELDSTYAFGMLRLARIERLRGDPEEAVGLLARYAELSGDAGMPFFEMSTIMRDEGDAPAADSLRLLALSSDPAAAENLAWSLFYNDMQTEAVEVGLEAAAISPEPSTLMSVSDLLSMAGRDDLADSLWSVNAQVFPDDPRVWTSWGLVLSNAGDYPLAQEKFSTAVALDSSSYEAMSYLGECYLFQNRYDEAREWLDRSLRIDPTAVFSICYLGLIRERMGDPSGALDHYLDALRISPGYSYAEERIRNISNPSYDTDYWRTESRIVSASIWADVSLEAGNTEERRYNGGAEAAWLYGPRGSRLSAEFRGSLEKIYTKERENTAWASLGIDYFLTGSLYAKAHSSWDRQPNTVRPWQVSSYTSIGYREWLTDWLYVSPEVGAGLVSSQWYLEEEKTDDWTSYLSFGLWMKKEESLLPALWIGAGFYLPPDDTDDYLANGNAELTFDAWDRISFTVGYSLDYTNRPVISSWEQLDSEIYSRINFSVF